MDIQPSDNVLHVNNMRVSSVKEFRAALPIEREGVLL
jgi:hypothetical protein